MSSQVPSRYRPPTVLRDLVLVDLLELTGSTSATGRLLGLSQPTVSRRYRSLASELGLQRISRNPVGRRFGDAPWMALLRRGINHHRLSCGVIRVGGPPELAPIFSGCALTQWVTPAGSVLAEWHQLLSEELLDAVVLPAMPAGHDSICQPFTVLELHGPSGALAMICRSELLVLTIAEQVHCWMQHDAAAGSCFA